MDRAATLSADRYFQQLRALGAWWRLGSSALQPQLLVDSVSTTASPAAGSGVDVTSRSRYLSSRTEPVS